MQIFRSLAGYSLGRADIVRRAMAKKKKKVMDEEKEVFIHGLTDDDGNVIIQFQGKKITVRHNRLKLLVPAAQLYPPDYDFSIIFDTVANRKAAHTMDRKFDRDAVIIHKEGNKEI